MKKTSLILTLLFSLTFAAPVQTANGNHAIDDVHTQLGNQLRTLLDRADFSDGYLRADDERHRDRRREPHSICLVAVVKLRCDVMNGVMVAISMHGKRVGNALNQWVELKKQYPIK